ncbi:coiled-coil domain-containing 58 [Brachionus plicatilis]|uniref:Protein MIX23 n=1 Tax=Brachionus plicatilis TaxID=10195 RepID=A0A3M7SXM0_BRAPC|nr:coiled-coil domain-containing 58 [Brachionus plicatilis]
MSNNKPLIVSDTEALNELDCSDPLKFQNRILRIRKFDDKIINILNAEIPTQSFINKGIVDPKNKCQQFKQELRDYYDSRESAIKKCIDYAKNEVEKLKQNPDTPLYLIKEKNFNFRFFQQELEIDSIDKSRTFKAVDERCRSFE